MAVGAWVLTSLWSFISMIGIMCLLFGGIALFLGVVLGVPMFAFGSFEAGDYLYGSIGVLATALIYGGLLNQT